MTLPGNNSAVLLLGRQRETHTRKPGVSLQSDLQQIPHFPDQNETRGNSKIMTGIPEGQEPLQCQYPSIPLPSTGSLWQSACPEHGGGDAIATLDAALSSPPLFSEQSGFLKAGKGWALNFSGSLSLQLALQLCGRWDEDSSWPAGHQPRDGDNVTIEGGRTLLLGTTTSILNLLQLKGLPEGDSGIFLLPGWGFSWPRSLLPFPRSSIRGDIWLCRLSLLSVDVRGQWWGTRGDFKYSVCRRNCLCCLRHNDNISKKDFPPAFLPLQFTKFAAVPSSVQW